MTITQEQRTYARLAGILILAKYVFELSGDGVTIMAQSGESFAETARYAAQSAVLWRCALLSVSLSWITLAFMGFALYVVLEPVHKRLAQLMLVLRLAASCVGAAGLMLRVGQARIYEASAAGSVFSTEQLSTLLAICKRTAGAGITTAWMFQGAGAVIFFLLFLRARFLPGWMARVGIVGSVLLVVASLVMYVLPQLTNQLKLVGVPALLAEVATAFWLLLRVARPRAALSST